MTLDEVLACPREELESLYKMAFGTKASAFMHWRNENGVQNRASMIHACFSASTTFKGDAANGYNFFTGLAALQGLTLDTQRRVIAAPKHVAFRADKVDLIDARIAIKLKQFDSLYVIPYAEKRRLTQYAILDIETGALICIVKLACAGGTAKEDPSYIATFHHPRLTGLKGSTRTLIGNVIASVQEALEINPRIAVCSAVVPLSHQP